MNAADDVDMNGEASGSNSDQNIDQLPSNSKDNDCGKHSSIAVGGARPKIKHLVCNIPNTINHPEDTVKINNNGPFRINNTENSSNSNNDVGLEVTERKLHNGANVNHTNGEDTSNGMDLYLRNNVNFHTAVDKCPLKVRSCLNNDNNLSSESSQANGACCVANSQWDDSSSDTGNEGELSGDECCIYTYKGDQMADLPSSFFRLDMLPRDQGVGREGDREQLNGDGGNCNGGSSSPEMDFLEMDFDPGPSCEQDSEESSNSDQTEEDASSFPGCSIEEQVVEPVVAPSPPVSSVYQEDSMEHEPGPSGVDQNNMSAPAASSPKEPPRPPAISAPWAARAIPHSRSSEASLGASTQRTVRDTWGHHCRGGDLCSPGEAVDMEGEWNNLRLQGEGKYNLHSAQYHCIMAKQLVLDKQASFSDSNLEGSDDGVKALPERIMIWSEQEASSKQVTQISTSACGATAVINVMVALNMSYSLDKIKDGVTTRLRAEDAPLPEYLFSRSVAGATHYDIIRGLELVSGGSLYSRFFPMFPDRVLSLTLWLAYWMKKGAVPIATVNLQNGIARTSLVPDAWHHQMVFGVGPRGVYMTNPLECLSEDALWPQLCSPSALLVRRGDVLTRWNDQTDLRSLMTHPDPRWKKMNVLGQVVNMARESVSSRTRASTQHIAIPAAYCSGITLTLCKEAPGYEELRSTPDLPFLR